MGIVENIQIIDETTGRAQAYINGMWVEGFVQLGLRGISYEGGLRSHIDAVNGAIGNQAGEKTRFFKGTPEEGQEEWI